MGAMYETIEELEAYLKPFNDMAEWVDNGTEEEATQRFSMFNDHLNLSVELPTWVTFPEPRDRYIIEAVAPFKYEVTLYGDFIKEGTDIIELYDSLDGDVQLIGDFSHISDLAMFGTIFVENRILVSYTDSDRHSSIRDHYLNSLRATLAYLKNPSSFVESWKFIDLHLAGWHLVSPDRHVWTTEGNCNNMEVRVYRTSLTEHVFHLTPKLAMDDKLALGVDVRLETEHANFEQAVIAAAKRLHHYYDVLGEERNRK